MTEKKVKVIRPHPARPTLGLRDFWEYRELLYFLVWKQIKTKYKQSFLGIGWAILQPLLLTFVFGLFFYRITNLPTNGIETYSFLFAGLILWTFISGTLNSASLSLIANANMISKVFFPRALVPLSLIVAGLLDYAIATCMFVVVVLLSHEYFAITAPLFLIPLALSFLFSSGLAFWMSAVSAKYRDIQYIIPFAISIGLFATPILYPITWAEDAQIRALLDLNPLSGIFTFQRWFLFGRPDGMEMWPLAYSAICSIAVFVGGLLYFKHYERGLADVI